MVSRTLSPVIRGTSGWYFSATGLGTRTGQYWIMETSFPSIRAMVSSTVKEPGRMDSTFPFSMLTGTMILWTMGPSWTVPRTCPAVTVSPTLTTGVKSHFFA